MSDNVPMCTILFPMAGQGIRFKNAGFVEPKPMIKVGDKLMIEWALDSIKSLSTKHKLVFIALEKDLDFGLSRILENLGEIVRLTSVTNGAVSSTLLASKYINNRLPLLILNCDQYINWDINDFINESINYDASVVVFESQNPHHSFIESNGDLVTRVEEKIAISNLACGGMYYYKYGIDYVEAAQSMISKGITTNGEYYISPVFNELIAAGKKITYFTLPKERIHMLGTPEEVSLFQTKLTRKEVSL